MFDTEFAIKLLLQILIQTPISVAIAYVAWQRGYNARNGG